jgi:enamine deaminase RidA (YjgF/YER057c/UK114 family)
MNRLLSIAPIALACAACTTAPQDVKRYPLGGGSTFPIARAVEVPDDYSLIFHSGFTPAPANPSATPGSPEYWGNTKTQASSAFAKLKESLDSLGLGFGDVVSMTVYLAGDPANGGTLEFAGILEAYAQHFGTKEQPNLPARSTVQVAALAAPGMLIEVEVVLARRNPRS